MFSCEMADALDAIRLAEVLGAQYEGMDFYDPDQAYLIDDTSREGRILHALQAYTEEEFEEKKSELLGPSTWVEGANVSCEIREDDLLKIIRDRGLSWLNRAMEVSTFDGSCLFGLAIAEDYECTNEIYETLVRGDPEFDLEDDDVIQAVAGCENCVEKLEKWAPQILGQDFSENTDLWTTLLERAFEGYDKELRDALYTKITPGALLDVVFSHWNLFLYTEFLCPGAPELVHVLDVIHDVLQPLVMDGDLRIEVLKKNCLEAFSNAKKEEPDPEVMKRLTRPTKSAIS